MTLLAGCGPDQQQAGQLDQQAAEETLSKADIPYRQVLQLIQVPDTQNELALVFYELTEGLGAGLLQKDHSGWKLVGSGSAHSPNLKAEQGLSWAYSDLGTNEMPFPLFYGAIGNPEISQVQMELAGGETTSAEIINAVSDDQRLWLLLPKGSEKPPVVAITGLSREGKALYNSDQSYTSLGQGLSSIDMVNETIGWALDEKSLLRTVDGGQRWTNVTPPGGRNASRGIEAEFLDANTSWIAALNDSEPQLTVFRTTDGWKSWEGTAVKQEARGELYGAFLDFIDPLNGWLMLEPEHGMSSRPGELYATTDGGENWSMVSFSANRGGQGHLPFSGPIGFRDATTGWLVGRQGAAFTPEHPLYITRDGGRSWQPQELSLPQGYGDACTLDIIASPEFFPPDYEEGVLPVVFVPKNHQTTDYAIIPYITRDGGKSWQSAKPLQPWGVMDFISANDGWIWTSEPRDSGSTAPVKGMLYSTNDGGQRWKTIIPDQTLQEFLEKGQDIQQLDFVTDKIGWALLKGPQVLLKSPDHPNPPPTTLLKTSDGGRTWTPIVPLNPFADRPAIELKFTPEPVEELTSGKPEAGWKEAESVNLTGRIAEGQVDVRLYVENGKQENFLQGEVWAFLETEGGIFDLGVVSSYGLHSADIRARDVNSDGQNELVITGGMGAAYVERKIIGYEFTDKRWVKLLTMGSPDDSDIDGDDQDDVLAVSGGSLPGYVWIFRWNKDHFEKADVAASTGNIYAYVNSLDSTTWIEAGKWVADKPSEPHYYQYRDGKLIEIPNPIPEPRDCAKTNRVR